MKKPAAKKAKRIVRSKLDASMSFQSLVHAIQHVHAESAAVVNRTVNTTLTLRNWVIGAYIREFEQHGSDRAKYGESVIDRLADTLESKRVKDLSPRTLRQCRQFYSMYPKIWQTLSAKSEPGLIDVRIWQTVSAKSPFALPASIVGTASPQSAELVIQESLTPKFGAPLPVLVSRLSFSHIAELLAIDQPLKRAFYEIECIRGNWSVRDLKRQIGALYFERSGLSKDKEKLSKMVNEGIEAAEPKLAIRDPYVFEFLGLRAKDAVAESDLEAALIEHMREFLLELGHGFCLEAQ